MLPWMVTSVTMWCSVKHHHSTLVPSGALSRKKLLWWGLYSSIERWNRWWLILSAMPPALPQNPLRHRYDRSPIERFNSTNIGYRMNMQWPKRSCWSVPACSRSMDGPPNLTFLTRISLASQSQRWKLLWVSQRNQASWWSNLIPSSLCRTRYESRERRWELLGKTLRSGKGVLVSYLQNTHSSSFRY